MHQTSRHLIAVVHPRPSTERWTEMARYIPRGSDHPVAPPPQSPETLLSSVCNRKGNRTLSKSHLHIASTPIKNRIWYRISKLNKNNLRLFRFFISAVYRTLLGCEFDCFVIIMLLGKGKFEFDLLRHNAYCIVHEIIIEASKKFKEARFWFERLFYNKRLTKVKIKNIQYIQLSGCTLY